MSDEIKKEKFSWNKFFIKITSRKLLVWAVTSIIFGLALYGFFVDEIITLIIFPLVIIWGVVSFIYLIGEPIEKGIGAMFENAKISAEAKFGAQANITTDTAKVIEAVKKPEEK